MKFKTAGVLAALALLVPAVSLAQADASLSISGSFVTGSYAQFDANIIRYQNVDSTALSVLTVSNASLGDIASAQFLSNGGWTTLTLKQSGSDVTGKFTSQTGFDLSDKRVMTMRINFKTPKTYVIGYSLENPNGKTLSSAAAPLTVNGPKVLGASTDSSSSASTKFTRRLSVGSSGPDVTALQNRLTAEGFYTGPITGYFGAQTKAGVKAYQTAHGIDPLGTVGPATLASLNQ